MECAFDGASIIEVDDTPDAQTLNNVSPSVADTRNLPASQTRMTANAASLARPQTADVAVYCEPATGHLSSASKRADAGGAITSGEHKTDNETPCSCGCVPNMPSLFQMAELRRQLRAQKLLEAKQLK
jgi:hypothetical protein